MGFRLHRTNLSCIEKKRYILVCTDYVTKWVEAKSLYQASEKYVVDFLYEDIFTHFGVPREIVTDHGAQFTSKSDAIPCPTVPDQAPQVFSISSVGQWAS
jgi:hypothetical protein